MSDIGKIIGRQREIVLLQEIYESPKAEFVAVYGRRRIGKTYLIDKMFEDKYDRAKGAKGLDGSFVYASKVYRNLEA